jgi:hypothetical protein
MLQIIEIKLNVKVLRYLLVFYKGRQIYINFPESLYCLPIPFTDLPQKGSGLSFYQPQRIEIRCYNIE